MLEVDQPLPSFSLKMQDGAVRTNASYAGKWLILHVYPESDSPGCAIQGKLFTTSRADFDARNAVVVGLSGETCGASGRACGVGCTIDLLADTGRTFLFVLGVGQSAWKGTPEWDRTTFLVDPKGVVRKVYTKIDPSGHEKLLLENLDALVRGSPPMEPRQRAGVAD